MNLSEKSASLLNADAVKGIEGRVTSFGERLALCTRCNERPRRAKHKWCAECHAENMRWYRIHASEDQALLAQKVARYERALREIAAVGIDPPVDSQVVAQWCALKAHCALENEP